MRMRHSWVLALACSVHLSAQAEIKYECLMTDDSTRLTVENWAVIHPNAIKRCLTVQVLRPGLGRLARVDDDDEEEAPLVAQQEIVEIQAPVAQVLRPLPRQKGSLMAGARRTAFRESISHTARRYGLDPRLMDTLIHVESRHQPGARSPKGAMGLMQIMPSMAMDYGIVDRRHLLIPEVNLDVGMRHFKVLLVRFNGRLDLALAAYNAGEGNVRKYGLRVPPFAETQAYVRTILRDYLRRDS